MLFNHLRKKLAHSPPALLGLDIDHEFIRLVELIRVNNTYILRAASKIPHLLHPQIHASWEHPQLLAALKLAIHEAGVQTRQVAFALPHATVLFKTVELDKTLNDREIAMQVRNYAEQYFNYPLSELMLDFEVLAASATHPDLQLIRWVAARRQEIEKRTNILASLGLKTTVVDVDCFALQRIAKVMAQSLVSLSQPAVVIHINVSCVLLTVFNQQDTIYTRVENYLTAGSDLAPTVAAILRALQSYLTSAVDNLPSLILISGLTTSEELLATVHAQTGIKVHVLEAFSQLECSAIADQITHLSPPEFAICTGLAMRSGLDYEC